MAIDVLFISCDGLSFQHGLTTPYREEHTLKRAMIERAHRVVALVDQSKFGNVQMFSVRDVRRDRRARDRHAGRSGGRRVPDEPRHHRPRA